MSQATQLLRHAQRLMAGQFPATIKLGIQTYAASTTGLRREEKNGLGGIETVLRVSFWLPRHAFAAAGQKIPLPGDPVECLAPGAVAGRYQLASISPDGAGANLLLACEAPAQ